MAKRLAVVFLAVLFFVFSTGCGKKGASEKEGKTFVYQLTSNPSTLDPQIASGEAAATVITALFEGLARQSEDGSAVPGAAESWTNNADYTEFTFTLREGLVWSDGETPVSAVPWTPQRDRLPILPCSAFKTQGRSMRGSLLRRSWA